MPPLKFNKQICPECGEEVIGTYCDACGQIDFDSDETVEDDYSEDDFE